MLYAHWEGFIKNCTSQYINFVHHQRLNYQELATCFAVLGIKSEIELIQTNKKAAANIAALTAIRSSSNRTAQFANFEVNTASNLKFDIFDGVATTIGIDVSAYETKRHFIDELVDQRNAIAHGNKTSIETQDYITKSDEVLALMRSYKTDIENSFSQDKFRTS